MLCYTIEIWRYIKDPNHIPVTLPAFLLLLKNIWEVFKMTEGYFKHRREKREENVIFNIEKNTIIRRKRDPKYLIGVSVTSLKYNYPMEIYFVNTDERFSKILNRLNKKDLFDKGFDIKTREYSYMGNMEEDKK